MYYMIIIITITTYMITMITCLSTLIITFKLFQFPATMKFKKPALYNLHLHFNSLSNILSLSNLFCLTLSLEFTP